MLKAVKKIISFNGGGVIVWRGKKYIFEVTPKFPWKKDTQVTISHNYELKTFIILCSVCFMKIFWNTSASWVTALVQQRRLLSSACEFGLKLGQLRFPNPLPSMALKCWSVDATVGVMRKGCSFKATWMWLTPKKTQQTETKSVAVLSICRKTHSTFALKQFFF